MNLTVRPGSTPQRLAVAAAGGLSVSVEGERVQPGVVDRASEALQRGWSLRFTTAVIAAIVFVGTVSGFATVTSASVLAGGSHPPRQRVRVRPRRSG